MIAQTNLGIICACLPTLGPIFQCFMPRSKTISTSTGNALLDLPHDAELQAEDRVVEMPPDARARGPYESADNEIHEMPITDRHKLSVTDRYEAP